MKYYVTFDADGSVNGRYIEGISNPPEGAGAVEIPENLWRQSGRETNGVWKTDPSYGLVKHPYPEPPTTADEVRSLRDSLLRDNYDRGVLRIQREIRMTSDDDRGRISALAEKLTELDLYAAALQGIPDQPGFPQSVEWPEIPTE